MNVCVWWWFPLVEMKKKKKPAVFFQRSSVMWENHTTEMSTKNELFFTDSEFSMYALLKILIR